MRLAEDSSTSKQESLPLTREPKMRVTSIPSLLADGDGDEIQFWCGLVAESWSGNMTQLWVQHDRPAVAM
ncbi:hypothetical protein MC885_012791 [Smutsia gigantea]|nr:hypothetical protein MC885_012791 [Smutsia gigantea]